MNLSSVLTIISFLLVVPMLTAPVWAGQFSVAPIRLEMGRTVKSGVVTVTNDGDVPIEFQMKAMEWTQDGDGKDVYTGTKDIVFYPKMMTVAKKESRIIRVGYNGAQGPHEKTYRLYIEELPGKSEQKGATVAIAIRFGVPLFIRSAKEKIEGTITMISVERGKASTEIRNLGSAHIKIDSVAFTGKDASGATVFEREVSGWYLLQGARRVYEVEIPADECRKLSSLTAAVRSNTVNVSRDLAVNGGMCQNQ